MKNKREWTSVKGPTIAEERRHSQNALTRRLLGLKRTQSLPLRSHRTVPNLRTGMLMRSTVGTTRLSPSADRLIVRLPAIIGAIQSSKKKKRGVPRGVSKQSRPSKGRNFCYFWCYSRGRGLEGTQ